MEIREATVVGNPAVVMVVVEVEVVVVVLGCWWDARRWRLCAGTLAGLPLGKETAVGGVDVE